MHHWIVNVFGFELNMDTLITMWLTMFLLLLVSFLATRKLSIVPTKLQVIFEGVISYFTDIASSNMEEKEAKKHQKTIEIKEIRIVGVGINDHDIDTKCNHIIRFLSGGDKVKITIRFRGREMGSPDRGLAVMEKIVNKCAEFGTVEKAAKLEGRNMLMFLAPKSSK